MLRQGDLQNSHCRALPGSIVALATFPCQLWSVPLLVHRAQLRRVAVAEVTILLLFHVDSLGSLECEGYRIAECTCGMLLFCSAHLAAQVAASSP